MKARMMTERMITTMALVLISSIGFLVPKAAAQSDKYSKMAPVEQYLMELFAWLQNFRRLLVRYERYAENFLGMLHLGCCVILLRHFSENKRCCPGERSTAV